MNAMQMNGFDATEQIAASLAATRHRLYTQVVDLLQDARLLTARGLDLGVSSAQAAAALAEQIDAIRTSLVSIANTVYEGQLVFGGSTRGSAAYDAGGTDLFTLLTSISAALRTNPRALTLSVSALDGALARLRGALATGATHARSALSDVLDVDLADVAVRAMTVDLNFQAALQTTSAIPQLSLVDFLH